MTVNTTRQYRPVSTIEADVDDGLSVRAINDLADSINNYATHAGAHKLRAQACIPPWYSDDNTTEERVIHQLAQVQIPDGFDNLIVEIGHERSQGTDNTVWHVYVDKYAYYGAAKFDSSKLSGEYETDTFTTSSGSPSIAVITIPVVRADWGTFILITAANGDVATRAALYTIDIWPAT